jgi:hypothetical protein
MSADPFILSRLRDVPLFQRLSADQLALVAAACQVLRFEAGSLVFAQGQASQGAMLFASGRAVLTQTDGTGQEVVVGQVREGQFASESALYNEGVEAANLRVVEPAVVIFLSRRKFAQVAASVPELRTNLRVPAQAPPPMQPQPNYGVSPYTAQPRFQTVNPPASSISAPPAPTNPPAGSYPPPSAAPPPASTENRASPQPVVKGQRPNESVLHIFHPHWWAFAQYMWIPALVVIVGLILAFLIGAASPFLTLTIAGIAVIGSGLFIVYAYHEWRENVLYITDQRVVRIWNFILAFRESVSEIPLQRVTEVRSYIPALDVMARVFGYGTVQIKTTSDDPGIKLRYVVDPNQIQPLIFSVRDQYLSSQDKQSESAIQRDIAQALGYTAASGDSPPDDDDQPVVFPPEGPVFARTRLMGDNNEVIYRRHWTSWLGHITLPALVLFGAILGMTLLLTAQNVVPGHFILLGGLIGIAVAAFWAYLADWDWRHDTLILTKDTVTFTHMRPLWMQNEVEQIRLAQVDTVISEVRGILNTLLRRGTVSISVVGSETNKDFRKIGNPDQVQMEISRRLALIKQRAERAIAEQQRQATIQYLNAYHALTAQGGQPPQNPPAAQTVPNIPPPGSYPPAQPTQPQGPAGLSFNPSAPPSWQTGTTDTLPPSGPSPR